MIGKLSPPQWVARPFKKKQENSTVMNEPRMDHIMQVGLGFRASKALLSAVEMEHFT
jgi:hypothetical protein